MEPTLEGEQLKAQVAINSVEYNVSDCRRCGRGASYTGEYITRKPAARKYFISTSQGIFGDSPTRFERDWWPPKKRRLSDARSPHSVSTCFIERRLLQRRHSGASSPDNRYP